MIDSTDAVAFARNTHATRVQVKIYLKILGLCVAKKSRAVTLTIDDEVGRARLAACAWSNEEHDQVFSKTVRAVKIRLFEK